MLGSTASFVHPNRWSVRVVRCPNSIGIDSSSGPVKSRVCSLERFPISAGRAVRLQQAEG